MSRPSHGVSTLMRALLVCSLLMLAIVSSPLASTNDCCVGTVGNVDCSPDNNVDIADLTALIDYMFVSLNPLCCPAEANCDADPSGNVDIADLTRLIDYMFVSLNPMLPCKSSLTYGQRKAVFDAIDSVDQTLDGLSLDTVASRMAAYLRTRPEIDSAGVEDSITIWARFTDGRLIVIPNNRFPNGLPGPAITDPKLMPDSTVSPNFVQPKRRFSSFEEMKRALARMSLAAAAPTASTYELPASVDAYVINTLEPCFTTNSVQIEALLGAGGYAVTYEVGTVEELLDVQNAGVFYIDAHGGKGHELSQNGPQSLGCIWTGTLVSAAGDSVYSSMIDSAELVYMNAYGPSGGCATHWRYAFTGKFVGQYMSFSKNSFAYMSACLSAGGPNYTGFFIGDGFKTAGVSVYTGWSKTVTDDPANECGEFLIDRMLGTNNSTIAEVENPKQRPFDITQLWEDMKTRPEHMDTDPTNQSKLIVTKMQDSFELLAPSIRYMFEVNNTDSFNLTGYFGTDPGPTKRRVKINGVQQQIYKWDPVMVTVKLPKTGPGSVGPVVVEVDGDAAIQPLVRRKSNTVNLTEWLGKVTYTHKDSSSLLGKIEYNIHLRADIHAFREAPHIAPHYYSTIFPGMEDISGTGSASGTHSWTDYTSDPPVTTTYTWYGSAPVVPFGPGLPFYLLGYVDGPAKIMKMQLYGAVVQSLHQITTWTPDGIDTSDISFDPPGELYDPSFFPFPFNIPINMGSTWELLTGGRLVKTCCSVHSDGQDTEIEHRFTWPTIPANYPPDPNAPQ